MTVNLFNLEYVKFINEMKEMILEVNGNTQFNTPPITKQMKEDYEQLDLQELVSMMENYDSQFPSEGSHNMDYETLVKRAKAPTYTFKYLKNVSKLTDGASFGELALIMDKPRAATIRATKS